MRRELKYIHIIAVIIASIIYLGFRSIPAAWKKDAIPGGKGEFFYVTRVVDGDTVILSDGERVRLIGVDTPELHYSEKLLRDSRKSHKDVRAIQKMGRRAADFTRSLCEGKKVKLEQDVEKHDRYGRCLGYLYLEDGTFINARILEEGYGQVMTVPPNVKYADYFLGLQQKAREGRKGLWNEY